MNPFSHQTDKELMRLYQEGENMAFDVIYENNKGKIYTYLNKRLCDENVINEVFQNILLKFHKTRMQYDSSFPLGKWIYTICRSELLDYVKKKKIIFEELKEEHLVVNQRVDLNTDVILDGKTLNENEKKAISLRYYSDKDFVEISKLLELSEPNVRKIISRGIKKLRLKLKGRHHG